MNPKTVSRVVMGVLLVCLVATLASAKHDKGVITVQNKAKSDGEVSFTFTPVGGEAQEIKVGVIKGMKPGDIAQDIMKDFTLALGDDYKVKMKATDKVLIEGNPKVKDKEIKFAIALAGSTVSGLSIVIN